MKLKKRNCVFKKRNFVFKKDEFYRAEEAGLVVDGVFFKCNREDSSIQMKIL